MRAPNMQVLTDQLVDEYPGIVVYGIGDEAHQGSPSGHNEDDTPGSRPEREDDDRIPEHRAIDAMIGRAFTPVDAETVTHCLVTRPANRRRLIYVIYRRRVWRKANGWRQETYRGPDPHDDHIHASGDPADDANRDPWDLDDRVPDDEEDLMLRPLIVGVKGKTSRYAKEPGQHLKPLSHPWQLGALKAGGAVEVAELAPSAAALVQLLGPFDGQTEGETVAAINRAS